jgi:hypothetical protein
MGSETDGSNTVQLGIEERQKLEQGRRWRGVGG